MQSPHIPLGTYELTSCREALNFSLERTRLHRGPHQSLLCKLHKELKLSLQIFGVTAWQLKLWAAASMSLSGPDHLGCYPSPQKIITILQLILSKTCSACVSQRNNLTEWGQCAAEHSWHCGMCWKVVQNTLKVDGWRMKESDAEVSAKSFWWQWRSWLLKSIFLHILIFRNVFFVEIDSSLSISFLPFFGTNHWQVEAAPGGSSFTTNN